MRAVIVQGGLGGSVIICKWVAPDDFYNKYTTNIQLKMKPRVVTKELTSY